MNEKEILREIHKMCIESLSPDMFEKWEEVKEQLTKTRQELK